MSGVKIVYGNDETGKTTFTKREISKCSIVAQTDPLSLTLYSNVAEFTITPENELEFEFSKTVPFMIYFDNKHQLKVYADKINKSQTSKVSYSIQASDSFEKLDLSYFIGDTYENKNALNLLHEIWASSKIDWDIAYVPGDEDFSQLKISGYMPYCTTRQALSQFMFNVGAYLRKSAIGIMAVRKLKLDEEGVFIPKERIKDGTKIVENDDVVSVTKTNYTLEYDSTSELSSRKNFSTGILHPGETVTNKKFIVNEFGEFSGAYKWKYPGDEGGLSSTSKLEYFNVEKHTNHLVASYKLKDTETKSVSYSITAHRYRVLTDDVTFYRDNVENTLGQNIDVVGQVLTSTETDIQNAVDRIFKYYSNNKYIEAQIYERKLYAEDGSIVTDSSVNVGDIVRMETSEGIARGIVVYQKYNLNGNILLKDSKIKVLDFTKA